MSDKKFHWINPDINVDFVKSPAIRELFEIAEQQDLARDLAYVYTADDIEVQAKGLYANGVISKAQWDLICERYPCI